MDISETLAPNSDQLDAIDLVDGERLFTVNDVHVNPKKGADQPVSIRLQGFPRVYRPNVMRRVLAGCWGKNSADWQGKVVALYNDPDVTYGPKKTGGIRIRAVSHIDAPRDIPILKSQGNPGVWHVVPLTRVEILRAEWQGATPERRAEIEGEVKQLETTREQFDRANGSNSS